MWDEGQMVMVYPWRQMALNGFLNALGNFLLNMTGAPAEALLTLSNGEMSRAVDMIAV